MEHTVIYLVVAFGGEWDDAWQRNKWSTLDKEKAAQYIIALEANQARHNVTVDKITEFSDAYVNRVGPCPAVGCQQSYPRWAPGISASAITEAMRSEREDIKASNAHIAKQNDALLNEYEAVLEKEIVEFLFALGYTDRDSIMQPYKRRTKDANFRIEEVPFNA
jgi:hypothetical protein